MLHENLEYQLSQALRYARDTKDFIHVSIESIQRNLPKEDKEAQRILQEFEYWKERLNTPSANAFYTMKEAKEIQDSLQKNEAITQEYHTALESYMPHIQSLQEKLNTIQNHIAANPKTKESMSLIPLQKEYTQALQKSEALEQALQSNTISPKDSILQDYHAEVVQVANDLLGDSFYEKAFVKTKQYNQTKKYDNKQGITATYPLRLAAEQRGIDPNSVSTLLQTRDKREQKELQQEHKLLNTIQKTLKDLIVMPIILVDSKGNAMPLTTQAIKNFILQSIKDELDHIATRHTLVKPEVNMIPLQSKLKALTYDIHKESTQTLRDMQTKASDFIESVENIREVERDTQGKGFVVLEDGTIESNYRVTMKLSPHVRDKENVYNLRENIKSKLTPMVKQPIINKNTQEVAILTNNGIRKMISDKAIAKSVNNGFSEEQHFRAVEKVAELFKNSVKALSKADQKDKNLIIHRYNAPFENANALLTLKEYQENGKNIYSLELEELNAAKINPTILPQTHQ